MLDGLLRYAGGTPIQIPTAINNLGAVLPGSSKPRPPGARPDEKMSFGRTFRR